MKSKKIQSLFCFLDGWRLNIIDFSLYQSLLIIINTVHKEYGKILYLWTFKQAFRGLMILVVELQKT